MTKGVLLLATAFFGFWLYQDPHGLAAFTSTCVDALWSWGQPHLDSLLDRLGDL